MMVLETPNRSIPRLVRIAMAPLLSAMLCAGAVADAGAGEFTDELADFSLEDLLEVDTVFGASKFEQKTSEAPASITVIRADEIRGFGYETLAEVLNAIRGFYSTYDRNYSYLGVRGFGRPGDYNSRILLTIDGHRANDNIYTSAAIGTDFPLDLDIVDRIEVIRGPGSSLYGTNAMFGVVNIVTKGTADLQQGGVEGLGSTGGAAKGSIRGGVHRGDSPSFAAQATYYRCEGDDLYFREFADAPSGSGWARGLDDDRYLRLFGKGSWGGFRFSILHGAREKGIPTAPWGTVFGDSRTYTNDVTSMATLTHEHAVGRTWKGTSRVTLHRYWYDGDYVFDYSEDDEPYLVVNRDEAEGIRLGAEEQWTASFSDRNLAIAGIEVRHHLRQDQRNFDEEVYLDDARSSTDWGAYLQHEFHPVAGTILNAGVRYDHYETFGGTVNPRAALIQTLRAGSTVKLLYGRAFRAPNVYELYYHDGGYTTKANPNLDPETMETWDLVLDQYLGSNVFLTVVGFHYDLEDLIEYTLDPGDDLYVFHNLDAARSSGVELELKRAWASGLTGRLSYGFQETTDAATGAVLSNAPKHMAKLNLLAPLAGRSLTAGLEMQYLSTRRSVQGTELDAHALTHVTVRKAGLWGVMDLSATVLNLFDASYMDPGSEEHLQDGIPQDGRSLRVRAGYRF